MGTICAAATGPCLPYLGESPRLNGFADDVVQSVFASFFAQAQAGQFVLDHRDDVWNLLGVMTVRKARQAIRREMADKRSGGQILNEAAPSSPEGSPPVLDAVPTTQLGPEFDLYAEEMLAGLPDELRTLAVLRLMGHTNSSAFGENYQGFRNLSALCSGRHSVPPCSLCPL